AERLAAKGVSVEVIDPRTVSPLDSETILASVRKTGRLLIVDEAFAPCGLGAEVAACVAEAGFDDLDAPIRRLHGAFTPTPYSPPLEKAVVPQSEDIERAIGELVQEWGRWLMAAPVTVPRLGWSMEEGTLLEWLKQGGDLVRPGDPLCVLESEKAAEQIEAIDGGILRIPGDAPKPGDRVQVGQVLAYLSAKDEVITASSAATPQAKIAPVEPVASAGPAAR